MCVKINLINVWNLKGLRYEKKNHFFLLKVWRLCVFLQEFYYFSLSTTIKLKQVSHSYLVAQSYELNG